MLSVFDLVLIINLPSRTDRLKEVRQQLLSVGYDFGERIRPMPAVKPADSGGFRSIGAHGCFRSHMACLSEASRSGASSLLILEDDVDFVRDRFSSDRPLTRYLSSGNWDLFYGGYSTNVPPSDASAPKVCEGLREAIASYSIGLTHFVAVSGRTIPALHDYLAAMLQRPPGDPAGGPMDVDGAYNWFRRSGAPARTMLADPQIGFQRASPSDVSDRKWYDRVSAFSGLARVARRLVKKGAE